MQLLCQASPVPVLASAALFVTNSRPCCACCSFSNDLFCWVSTISFLDMILKRANFCGLELVWSTHMVHSKIAVQLHLRFDIF